MEKMKKIMLVFGTRPEAVKMCPLVSELKKRGKFDVFVCSTGQHREMLDTALYEFGVTPDFDMNIMREGQRVSGICSAVLSRMGEILHRERPDIVLVHGDTSSAYAAALSAFFDGVPIGHVEAGLRTGNMLSPFPEEFNRRSVSLVASYHFAPTLSAAKNLLREGISENKIFITGNTVVDALGMSVRENFSHKITDLAAGKDIIFVTAHRRESRGEKMAEMMRAVRRIAERYESVFIVLPMHKNPELRKIIGDALCGAKRVMLSEPLGVFDCHNIIARSKIVISDSGGIQEEAATLGVPTVVMREHTERAEGMHSGILQLAGTDEKSIFTAFKELYENPEKYKKAAHKTTLFGDGGACRKIADILEKELCAVSSQCLL